MAVYFLTHKMFEFLYFCWRNNIVELIHKYFPDCTAEQYFQFEQMSALYREWNARINVISRTDIDALYERHVLHALGIAKCMRFLPGSSVLDVGTGGGFPGIPLAVLFPETQFYLVDSIGKKIKVVQAVSEALGLENLAAQHIRAEQLTNEYDFIVSRAVAQMSTFVNWVGDKIAPVNRHEQANGIFYLKGGDLTQELAPFPKAKVTALSDYFSEDFFQTKSVVYLPLN